MNWKEHIGKEVVYEKAIKCLDKGTVGILKSVYGEKGTVIYPQNSAFQYDEKKDTWIPIKGSSGQIYCHSVDLCDIKIND